MPEVCCCGRDTGASPSFFPNTLTGVTLTVNKG